MLHDGSAGNQYEAELSHQIFNSKTYPEVLGSTLLTSLDPLISPVVTLPVSTHVLAILFTAAFGFVFKQASDGNYDIFFSSQDTFNLMTTEYPTGYIELLISKPGYFSAWLKLWTWTKLSDKLKEYEINGNLKPTDNMLVTVSKAINKISPIIDNNFATLVLLA